MMAMDKLYNAVNERGLVCLGLDTSFEYLPTFIKNGGGSISEKLLEFNKRIIDATYDEVACFKVQIAYYEAYGLEGMKAYAKTLEYLREKKSLIIADIKRGDIQDTAKMYAKAHFQGEFEADFITLSPYMGLDSIEPYLEYVRNKEKGLFVLLRTSNKGSVDLQSIDTAEGKVYEVLGGKLRELGKEFTGEKGYSSVGLVVGCTHREEGKKIREENPNGFFLIPGYGAQGGTAEDVALCLKGKNGGVVNSSRKILLAYKNEEGREESFDTCAREEVLRMKMALSQYI